MAKTRRHRGSSRRRKCTGGSRRRRHGGVGDQYGMPSSVSNIASGVGSSVDSVGSSIGSFFSNAWNSTKKAAEGLKGQVTGSTGTSGYTMGGRRHRRKRGGNGNVVGFDDMWRQPGPAVGGRRRKRKH